MTIGLLYEFPETDEMGIGLTAEELGIELVHIPFRKVSILLEKGRFSMRATKKSYSNMIRKVDVILNRAQSKHRRLYAASIFEALGKSVINPSQIEYTCFSKLRTLLKFWSANLSIPRTVFIPYDPTESRREQLRDLDRATIIDLIEHELGAENIVVKPDAGTHGTAVRLARDKAELMRTISEVKPSRINPIGILAQELVQKWIYDLRIIVVKELNKAPFCYPRALARAGYKDFRTNTYLGNFVFGVNLPSRLLATSLKCAQAVAGKERSWILGLDALPKVGETRRIDHELKSKIEKLTIIFDQVKRVKLDESKRTNFRRWNQMLEEAFEAYTHSEPYAYLADQIQQNLSEIGDGVLFHEANACPEFWEQTRLVAGINLAEPLLRCAERLTPRK
jgi:glutathione synthase/RimK-type ligase-like ATP-grasp enzyme